MHGVCCSCVPPCRCIPPIGRSKVWTFPRSRATVTVVPLGEIHLAPLHKWNTRLPALPCIGIWRRRSVSLGTVLQVVMMQKYSFSLKTLFRVRNASNPCRNPGMCIRKRCPQGRVHFSTNVRTRCRCSCRPPSWWRNAWSNGGKRMPSVWPVNFGSRSLNRATSCCMGVLGFIIRNWIGWVVVLLCGRFGGGSRLAAVLQLAEFLLLVSAGAFCRKLPPFPLPWVPPRGSPPLGIGLFAHLYLVLVIVVDCLPEYLPVREAVATLRCT